MRFYSCFQNKLKTSPSSSFKSILSANVTYKAISSFIDNALIDEDVAKFSVGELPHETKN